jgi:hypothetical protein
MAQNIVAAAAWWLLAGNAIVLGCAVLLEFAPRTLSPVFKRALSERGASTALRLCRTLHIM